MSDAAKREGREKNFRGRRKSKGCKMPESAKALISAANKGKRLSLETRQKISLARRGKATRWGFHCSDETKRKIGAAQKGQKNHNWGKTGDKSPNWRGGLTRIQRLIRNSARYREWRTQILRRDDFTCQICGVRGVKLQVDHYPRTFAEIVHRNFIEEMDGAIQCDELWDLNNGRTLCLACHKLTDTYLRKFAA